MCMAIPMDRHLHMRSALQGSQNRLLAVVAGVLLFAWFLFLVSGGLRCWFDADDLMNMCYYWTKPWSALLKANLAFWSSYYRPAGGLFYRSIYALWGFHPLPFRIAVLALLPVDFALLALVVWQFTESYWAVLIALLLLGVNPTFVGILRYRQYLRYIGIRFLLGRVCALRADSPGGSLPGWGACRLYLVCSRPRWMPKRSPCACPLRWGCTSWYGIRPLNWRFAGTVALGPGGGPFRSYRRIGRHRLFSGQEVWPGVTVDVGCLPASVFGRRLFRVVVALSAAAYFPASDHIVAGNRPITGGDGGCGCNFPAARLLWGVGFIAVGILPIAFIPAATASRIWCRRLAGRVCIGGLLDWLLATLAGSRIGCGGH